MLSHFSLFSGIGGIDLAAEWAGFKTVGMCEIDKYCKKVLDKHWPDVPKWGDVFELTGKEILETCGTIDLLSGGFPCQPFSMAGKRQGKKDERYLWPEMLRIIREVKPRWVLGENVRGLLSIDNNRIFGTILKDLAESGYRVGWLCYGAGDIGAPHKRERVFIVAHASCQLLNRPGNPGQTGRDEFANSGVANPYTKGLQGAKQSETFGEGQGASRSTAERHSIAGSEGTTQSRLGGMFNGFSAGLDGHGWPVGQWPTPTVCGNHNRKGLSKTSGDGLATAVAMWPAGPGEQYEWEPPRVATGIKNRVARLKALGNAVVPAQVYPILKAIAEIEKEANQN